MSAAWVYISAPLLVSRSFLCPSVSRLKKKGVNHHHHPYGFPLLESTELAHGQHWESWFSHSYCAIHVYSAPQIEETISLVPSVPFIDICHSTYNT